METQGFTEYSMRGVSFDTHKVVKDLVSSGLKQSAAETIVKTIQVATTASYENLATREEFKLAIQSVNARIDRVESKIEAAEERLNARIDALANQLIIKLSSVMVAALGLFFAAQHFIK